LSAASNLGSAFQSITVAPAITITDDGNATTAVIPTANAAAFDGSGQPLIFAGTDGVLGTDDVVEVTFTALIDPNATDAPADLENTASATGNDPSGTQASDDSGGDAGGPGDPTPLTPPSEDGTIGLVKSSVLNDDDGTTGVSPGDTIDYTYIVTNTSTTVK